MFSLLLHCAPEDVERLSTEIWLLGAEGAAEEPGALRVFFSGDARAAELTALWAAFAPEFRAEPDVDYAAQTRESFPPLEIGRSFFLVPPWSGAATPPGRLRLIVEPGMACGTGWHPCTQLCLQAMEELLTPGASLFDVGCGSGILSEAARLLGAGRIAACDVDEDAVRIARAQYGLDTFAGSLDAVRERSFDVLVANISPQVVAALAARAAGIAPALILSGFTETDLPALPFPAELRRGAGDWCCLVRRASRPD